MQILFLIWYVIRNIYVKRPYRRYWRSHDISNKTLPCFSDEKKRPAYWQICYKKCAFCIPIDVWIMVCMDIMNIALQSKVWSLVCEEHSVLHVILWTVDTVLEASFVCNGLRLALLFLTDCFRWRANIWLSVRACA